MRHRGLCQRRCRRRARPQLACFGLHLSEAAGCLKLVGGSPTTSSPSTPSVGPAAHAPPTQAGPCSSLGAANRRFPATPSRQTRSMPLGVPAGLRIAQACKLPKEKEGGASRRRSRRLWHAPGTRRASHRSGVDKRPRATCLRAAARPLLQQHDTKLSETFRWVVQHGKHRDSSGIASPPLSAGSPHRWPCRFSRTAPGRIWRTPAAAPLITSPTLPRRCDDGDGGPTLR